MQALGDDDKANIEETIDDEVLKRQEIVFRSTSVAVGADGRTTRRRGRVDAPRRRPVRSRSSSQSTAAALTGSAVVKQSDWGISPYSTLFGTLKVVDEVEVVLDAVLPPS